MPEPLRRELRWNDLRRIGNSPIARASITVPVLGYLILFHSDLINYLKIHSSFCGDCTVSWRLHALYFACCSLALGSIVYAWRCPQTIKSYQIARDFFEAERTYFCNPQNLTYLFKLFESDGVQPDDPLKLRAIADRGEGLSDQHALMLSGIMGQYYFIQNRKRFWSRVVVAVAYAIGFILLAIPAVITFAQVLIRSIN